MSFFVLFLQVKTVLPLDGDNIYLQLADHDDLAPVCLITAPSSLIRLSW